MSRFLMDTHVVLWWAEDNPRLASTHRNILQDGNYEILLSAVSVWEVSIKTRQGKLKLPLAPLPFFLALVERYRFQVIPVHLAHAAEVFSLPKVHADPFDRLLIAQARCEEVSLLSEDAIFEKYQLPGLVGR